MAERLPGGSAPPLPRPDGHLHHREERRLRPDAPSRRSLSLYIDYFFYDKTAGVPHWQEICKYTLPPRVSIAARRVVRFGDLDDANKRKVEKPADLFLILASPEAQRSGLRETAPRCALSAGSCAGRHGAMSLLQPIGERRPADAESKAAS